MGRVSGGTDGSGKWRDLMGRVSGGICRWRDRW